MAERKTYTAEDFKGCNGRRVWVEGVIRDDHPEVDDVVTVHFGEWTPNKADVPRSAIVEILPEEIKVGDRVKPSEACFYKFREARVVAISNPRAWVECADGGQHFALLSDLTPVERAQ